jgi:hypothetical protein
MQNAATNIRASRSATKAPEKLDIKNWVPEVNSLLLQETLLGCHSSTVEFSCFIVSITYSFCKIENMVMYNKFYSRITQIQHKYSMISQFKGSLNKNNVQQ